MLGTAAAEAWTAPRSRSEHPFDGVNLRTVHSHGTRKLTLYRISTKFKKAWVIQLKQQKGIIIAVMTDIYNLFYI